MKKGRRSYKFTGKTHSKKAILGFSLALLTLITYVVFVYMSYQAKGQLSTYYGAFGVLAMMVAIVAFVFSIITLKEEDSFLFFPRLAVVISLLSSGLWIWNYIQGFMRG
ncbi:MAG: hypothetical protein IKJ16_06580 [Agathobacter sp.]|nr:hypothetical protein [Agathobacter sp.]